MRSDEEKERAEERGSIKMGGWRPTVEHSTYTYSEQWINSTLFSLISQGIVLLFVENAALVY